MIKLPAAALTPAAPSCSLPAGDLNGRHKKPRGANKSRANLPHVVEPPLNAEVTALQEPRTVLIITDESSKEENEPSPSSTRKTVPSLIIPRISLTGKGDHFIPRPGGLPVLDLPPPVLDQKEQTVG